MKPFEIDFSLPRERYDEQGKLKYASMLYLCQEAAGAHCRELGLDWDTLQQRDLFWAVIRVQAQLHHLPTFGQTLHAVTWPMPTTRSAFPRTTECYDEHGTLLFTVTNLWVLVDTKKRSMLLPAKSGVTLEGITLGRELPLPGSIYPDKLANERPRRVIPADIDRNGHVNNTRYVEWLTELLGPEAPPIRQLHAVYQNEALLDDSLVLSWEKTPEHFALEIRRPKEKDGENSDRIFAARVEF